MRRLPAVVAVVATVMVVAPNAAFGAAPSNDAWTDKVGIPSPAVLATNTREATLQAGEYRPCGLIGKTVWYRFDSNATQVITVNTFGSNFDTVLALYVGPYGEGPPEDGPPQEGTLLGCNDDASGTQQSKVRVIAAEPGAPIYIQAGGYRGASGRLVINLRTRPGNDRLAQASPLFQKWWEGEYGLSRRDLQTKKATMEAGEPQPCAPIGRSVWYALDIAAYPWMRQVDRTLQVSTEGSDFDTVLAVYRVPRGVPMSFGNLVLVGCDDDSGPGTTSELSVAVYPDDKLYIQVGGYDGQFGDLVFSSEVSPWP